MNPKHRFGLQFSTGVISDWRTGQMTLNGTYASPTARDANQIVLVNSTGKELAIKRAGTSDAPLLLSIGATFTMPLVRNTDELAVKNNTDADSVTLSYYTAQ